MKVREVLTLATDPSKRVGMDYIENVSGLDDALAERIVSRPATGEKQVFNIVWDPVNEEIIIEIAETTTT